MNPQLSSAGPDDALSAQDFAALRRISSPTIANAIETLHARPRGAGITDAGLHCVFPEFGVMLGYACTATILSGQPAAPKRLASRTAYWEYTRQSPGPRVTVVQDLSAKSGGAYWGEVNSTIHLTLGSVGVITNGTVRDLEEVRATGFHLFAGGVTLPRVCAPGRLQPSGGSLRHDRASGRPHPCRPARRGGDSARMRTPGS